MNMPTWGIPANHDVYFLAFPIALFRVHLPSFLGVVLTFLVMAMVVIPIPRQRYSLAGVAHCSHTNTSKPTLPRYLPHHLIKISGAPHWINKLWSLAPSTDFIAAPLHTSSKCQMYKMGLIVMAWCIMLIVMSLTYSLVIVPSLLPLYVPIWNVSTCMAVMWISRLASGYKSSLKNLLKPIQQVKQNFLSLPEVQRGGVVLWKLIFDALESCSFEYTQELQNYMTSFDVRATDGEIFFCWPYLFQGCSLCSCFAWCPSQSHPPSIIFLRVWARLLMKSSTLCASRKLVLSRVQCIDSKLGTSLFMPSLPRLPPACHISTFHSVF